MTEIKNFERSLKIENRKKKKKKKNYCDFIERVGKIY